MITITKTNQDGIRRITELPDISNIQPQSVYILMAWVGTVPIMVSYDPKNEQKAFKEFRILLNQEYKQNHRLEICSYKLTGGLTPT